jgi:hypothetical protein
MMIDDELIEARGLDGAFGRVFLMGVRSGMNRPTVFDSRGGRGVGRGEDSGVSEDSVDDVLGELGGDILGMLVMGLLAHPRQSRVG